MDNLNAIFEKEILLEASKAAEELKEYYSKVERLINLDITKRPRMNYLFYLFPYLFKEEFSCINDEDMRVLSKSGILCIENVMFFDNFCDSEFDFSEDSLNNTFEKYMFNQYQMRLLCRLFDENSEFWSYYDKYHKQYFEALRLERCRYKNFKEYGYDEYKKITRGIYSLWKFQIAALGCLSKNTQIIKKYEEILDLEAEASQLFDDLKDWKDDYNEKRYSWLISKIMLEHGLSTDTDISKVSELLFMYNYDSMVLEKINVLCESIMLKTGKASNYIRKIRAFQYKANKLNNDLYSLKGISSFNSNKDEKINENILRYGLDNFIQTCIDLIVIQKGNSYPELAHWVAFLNPGGFSSKDCFGTGDVFQRAYILNLLIELKEMGYDIKDKVFQSEADALIDRWEEKKYGWSYFTGIDESLADIDILAEIIKINSKLKNTKLEDCINISLNQVFSIEENSLLLKWISNEKEDVDSFFALDENGNGFISTEESMLKKACRIWGKPYDPASNASLIFALSHYEKNKYQESIDNLISSLLNIQSSNGNWESEWYVSPYYTWYQMSRIFSSNKTLNEYSAKLIQFVKESHNEDVSRKKDSQSVLDTAFAALTLLELDFLTSHDELITTLKKWMDYILINLGEDNFWRGTPFLKLSFNSGADQLNTRIYKSSIFTTSICIYAIAKIHYFIKHYELGGGI